jgi:hypothetical protein
MVWLAMGRLCLPDSSRSAGRKGRKATSPGPEDVVVRLICRWSSEGSSIG